ncbi:MAG: hypothetical protein E6J89_12830 [Deltaproteobacteria bacterium]|nr:MAG: hypothetical protein E6J89_12830 [Deltaproteobacteria bacterium]
MNDAELADALMDDYRTAPIEAEMKHLLSFAEKVARDATLIASEDIEALRSAGFSDRAILDAAHVAGFFGYMNRVVQALGADSRTIRTEAAQGSTASPAPFHYDVAT